MIQITDKYFIKVEDRQYIVSAKSVVQSGKSQGETVWVDSTYHGTMLDALTNVLRRMQRDKLNGDNIISLAEAVKEIKAIQNEFTNIVKGLEEHKQEVF